MPVQYQTIPQFQMPEMNLLGSFAQGQAMATNRLRDQVLQNQLEDAQRKRAIEDQQRAVIMAPGFDLTNRAAVKQITGAGDIDTAMKLYGVQSQAEMHAAAQANQLSDALLRRERFNAELPGIRATAQENVAKASKAKIELFGQRANLARDYLAQAAPDGSNWADITEYVTELDPTLKPPAQYDKGWVNRAMKTATMYRDIATEELKKRVEAGIPKITPPSKEFPSGTITGPAGVSKLKQIPLDQQGYSAADFEMDHPEITGSKAWDQPQTNTMAPVSVGQNKMSARALPQAEQEVMAQNARRQRIMENAPLGKEDESVAKVDLRNAIEGIGGNIRKLAEQNKFFVPGESTADTVKTLFTRGPSQRYLDSLGYSERVKITDLLKSQIDQIVPLVAHAAGLQSKNFDAAAESERLRNMAGDPDNIKDIASAFERLNNLNKIYGSGADIFNVAEEAKGIIGARRGVAGETPSPTEAPKLPAHIDSKIKDIWGIK